MDVFPSKLLSLKQQCFSMGGDPVSRCQVCCLSKKRSPLPQQRMTSSLRLRKLSLENIPCSNGVAITKIFQNIDFQNCLFEYTHCPKLPFLVRCILFWTSSHDSLGQFSSFMGFNRVFWQILTGIHNYLIISN